MPSRGRPVAVIDRYTMSEIARYRSVREASADLGIPQNTVYQSLCLRVPVYESYFVYEGELDGWSPSERMFMKVRGLRVSARLEELRRAAYERDKGNKP